MSLNQVVLVGRLGRDPELKYTQAGKAVLTLSLATDEGYGDNKRVEWHRLVAWEKTAESAAEYLHKGSLIAVVGRLQTREYEKDGNKQRTTEVVVQTLRFLDKKDDSKPSGKPAAKPKREEIDEDSIPF